MITYLNVVDFHNLCLINEIRREFPDIMKKIEFPLNFFSFQSIAYLLNKH